MSPTSKRLVWGVLAAALACVTAAQAQTPATVREYQKVFNTYPFSDPNPIPVPGRIYPYFRFDGYTDVPVERSWTVVELENDYLRVQVLPQIGGKIWTAVEKASGRDFLYNNGVVKFRDIAMRGPWTSGGIEANYGIVGHTPNCATPVDYVTRTHPDGSASVTIGVLDLLTRTPWRIEIALPAGAAYFTTRSHWQNTTPLEQPYYTWMNVGLKAKGNLQFVYPGTHYLGHGGEASPWPRHPENGKDLSFYDQNDFGPYKSYHVFGRYTQFFGAYWHDEDFGMARYSPRDDKPGKKIWIWGLSRQGMIWEDLLTDTSGQYVEVQSGRLFNQEAEESVRTPFKHRGFAPGATDTWTEYWFPVKGTMGLVKASDAGALNVRHDGGTLSARFMALRKTTGTLQVLDGTRVVVERAVSLVPMQVEQVASPEAVPDERLRVVLRGADGSIDLEHRGNAKGEDLARPIETPADFDWDSVYGLYVKGKQALRRRAYEPAVDALEACLAKDRHFAPALVDLAALKYRAMDYQGTFDLARRALAIDTYDPGANYHYGLAAAALGRNYDARDGFEIATQSLEFRTAAWHQLARLAVRERRLDDAVHYAQLAADRDALDVEARLLLAVARRLAGDSPKARMAVDAAHAIDPLNHTAAFERARASDDPDAVLAFASGVKNEMPDETFLELAAWYDGVNEPDAAMRVLELSPTSAEALYWRAFLLQRTSRPFQEVLDRASEAAPLLVFPFRPESARVMQWAVGVDPGWRPRYYLALIQLGLGNAQAAGQLLEACGDQPDFAPFYATRAHVREKASPDKALGDLRRALAMEPAQWRFTKLLAERLIATGAYAEALDVAQRGYRAAPRNYILGLLAARALLLNDRHRDSADLLASLHVLPYEGANDGQRLYRESQLMLAIDAGNDATAALRHVEAARQWPERLGAGKPYPEDVDERIEDWIEWRVRSRAKGATGRSAPALLERLAANTRGPSGAGALARALALREAGKGAEAAAALAAWEKSMPEAAIAAWGRSMFEGKAAKFPKPAHEAAEYGVIASAVP
jgi:tetratricopeptide (TPR) repeat protein